MRGEEMLEMLEFLDDDLIMESAILSGEKKYHGKMRMKKCFVFLLAATLVLALGALVVSAGIQRNWDKKLLEFMGISGADTIQLADGTVLIGVSDTCSGRNLLTHDWENITFTASSSIGDKNAVYIRIDTDFEVPEDFNPEIDYFMAEDFNLEVQENSLMRATDRSSVLQSEVEDGKLFFLLEISGAKNVDRSKISLTFENLYYYHDLGMDGEDAVPEELAFEGCWNLEWKFDYKTKVKSKRMYEKVQVGKEAGHLTLVEVTPLGIRFEGSVAIESWDIPTGKLSAMKIDKITMKDGREIEITELDSWGASRGSVGYKFRGYYGVGVLKEPLDPREVESITTDGKEIKL